MTTPVVHYLSNTLIERKRVLTGPARILVRRGQIVTPGDPVVDELFTARHLLFDTVRGLRVSPERAEKLFCGKVGSSVSTGDILAGPVGLARRTVRATAPGKIVASVHGRILLELDGSSHPLKAGLPGEVVDLIPDRGVVIQTSGALVQGVWGNGRTGQGKVHVINEKSEQALTAEQVGPEMNGEILVVGYSDDPDLFEAAIRCQVMGLIFGGVHPTMIMPALNAPIPILVLEGFGKNKINPDASQVLLDCSGLFGALNAEPLDPLRGGRPELVVPNISPEFQKEPRSYDFLSPGKRVRLAGVSRLGCVGRLIDLIGELTLPNGIVAAAATIELFNGEILTVPLVNLELLD